MSLYTFHSSQHRTAGTHVQVAVSASAGEEDSHFSARARIGTRGGVRVAFDTASTTVHRSFNGDARRKSGVKVLVDHPGALIINRCRLMLRRGHACRSRLCSDSHSVLTAARTRLVCVRPSKLRSKRSTAASCRRAPVASVRERRERGENGFCRTRYFR